MRKIEQICRHERHGGVRRFLKRSMSRLHRRLARRDPEGAPRRRVYRGYTF